MITCKQCQHTKNINSKECIHREVTPQFMEKFNWNPERLALECKFFKKDIKEGKKEIDCICCGETMTNNQEWFYADTSLEKVPVCSINCKDKIEKEIKEIEERVLFDSHENEDIFKEIDFGSKDDFE